MNRSLLDVKGSALVVSQFTLYGDARGQRRPSYIRGGGAGAREGIIRGIFGGASQAGSSCGQRSLSGHDVRGAGE